uniref:Uncharacterized protein n=1 Tax=Acrobeloides nanus TaxID=290746 RepID=A0A914CJI5_9BILA
MRRYCNWVLSIYQSMQQSRLYFTPKSDEPGQSQVMEPMPYDFMDYESLIEEGNLQEGITEHTPNKP